MARWYETTFRHDDGSEIRIISSGNTRHSSERVSWSKLVRDEGKVAAEWCIAVEHLPNCPDPACSLAAHRGACKKELYTR